MTSITIRDLRQKWPQAETLLQELGELLVTRDAKPIAKLVRVDAPKPARKRFNPVEHAAWQKSVFGDKTLHLVDRMIADDRDEPA